MKKKYITMITVCLCISMLTGCEKTPEEAIVKEKGAESIKEYESTEETDSPLMETLKAPEHYTNQASYENGVLVIDTDADVFLPNVSKLNTYGVAAKEVNQELIDTVTKAFFEGDKIYNGWSYTSWTKEQYQEQITRLKKYKAEGNLDPYEYGTDENGELYYNIEERIAGLEEDMKTAPDEIIKKEVTPALGLEYPDGEKGEDTFVWEDGFDGVAETAQGNYDYSIDYALAPDIVFKISKIRDDVEDPQEFTSWTEGEYLLDSDETSYSMSEDKVKEFVDISYEDAEKLAKEKIDKLGWDLEVSGWDYALFHHGEGGIREDNVLDGGYIFHFARMIDKVPVTYTSDYGGGLEDMDSTLTPWSYERCQVIVGDDGIQQVEIYNPYEVGEVQTENVKLMDFDSIVKIYEQMMEVSNADIAEVENQRTYHIKKITLGYGRIYDPTTDSDTGLLVPVWDFFGGFDAQRDGYSDKNSGEHSTRSYMTINAIDGTVIDRSLGY